MSGRSKPPGSPAGVGAAAGAIAPAAKLSAPAALRNRGPILAVLRRVLPPGGLVLEVASGSGEHAAYFAEALPELAWQPSEVEPEFLGSIAAHAADSGAPNLRWPIHLDVTSHPWPVQHADALFCANLIHIAPWTVCAGLLRGAGAVLAAGGVCVLYGPYRVGGRHTADSNAAFDRALRAEDARWGVRDLEAVVALGESHGLDLAQTVEMPANNLCVVLRRQRQG